jgi:predicted nucleic acid-binding protein
VNTEISPDTSVPYLLDTSALITFIEKEPGMEQVRDLLGKRPVLLPFVTLMEAYYIALQEQGQAMADRRYHLIQKLPVTILWQVNESTLRLAARFKAAYRISFADALIAGFAAAHNAILVHQDPEYEVLKDKLQLEPLPYKSQSV